MKKYKIKQLEIAKYFGYMNETSFHNSSKKEDILKGIELLIKRIEKEIINKIEK